MRLVLDTNVVIAALLWKGPPHEVLGSVVEGHARCYSSQALTDELARALQYAKFRQRLSEEGVSPQDLVDRYMRLAKLVVAADIGSTVTGDPDDDHVLACALAARADMIVSGDVRLLNLKAYQGMPIVSPAEALARLAQR
ncbi:MAG: putative toxin-antitoxin system toxin component, PIN family [Burkholderiales bacterium]